MRRIVSSTLLLLFLAQGSGTVQYFHAFDHRHECSDAAQNTKGNGANVERAAGDCDPDHCSICLAIHAHVWHAGIAALVIVLAVLSARLLLSAQCMRGRLAIAGIDCRGPPVL